MVWRWRPAALLLLAALAVGGLAARNAQADELSEFEKARNAYLARAYDEADTRFRVLLDGKAGTLKDRALIAQARMFWGAALFARGQKKEATAVFEQLLLEDPQFEPDPLSFPTSVVNEFIDTRARIRQLLKDAAEAAARKEEERRVKDAADKVRQAARVARLEKLAAEETVVVPHSRLVATLPFGIGQFQNGQDGFGWFYLGTEGALLVAGAVTLPVYLSNLASSTEAYNQRDSVSAQQYVDRANDVRTANLAIYGALAVTAVIGVVHAHVTFVPEVRTTRPRTLPKPVAQGFVLPWLAPTFAPPEAPPRDGPVGMTFGLQGRF